MLELALRLWLLSGCTDSVKHKGACELLTGAKVKLLRYHLPFCLSYSACRPTWTDSQLPGALQGEEHLLLGHHSEEMSRGRVCAVREVEVEASLQGS